MITITIAGRLVKDPELKTAQSGTTFCQFTVAAKKKGRPQEGEKDSEFFNVTLFGGAATRAADYLRKGGWVGITGDFKHRTYHGNNGTGVALEITANDFHFIGPKETAPSRPAAASDDEYDALGDS